ncbi:sensor histidine kinase [Cohnella silvisoli]|uniref:Histidine kinase n=1 Tax=Cohnella silvisoli TaxID=2873699 RepID=A0ABV1KTB7_9BACL|nr:histidine kinase [Cohnella silvisoli]MCD9021489.1 sensor histidine kinase [Cohnella silvisoli]
MRIFKKYIRNHFINKLLLSFICIIIVTSILLSLVIGNIISKHMTTKEFQYNDVIMYNVNQYMDSKYKLIQTILYQAFMDKTFIADVFNFLNEDFIPYSAEFYNAKPVFDNYMNSAFSRDPDMTAVSFYKIPEERLYQYSKVLPNTYTKQEFAYPEQLELNDPVGNPLIHIYPAKLSDYLLDNNRLVFTLAMNVSSRNNDRNAGILLCDFDLQGFNKMLANFNSGLNSQILLIADNGDVVYDSDAQYYGAKFPYWGNGAPLSDKVRIGQESNLIKTLRSSKSGLTAVSIIPEKNISALVKEMRMAIYLFTTLSILMCIALIIVSSFFLTKRIKFIIQAIKELRKGNLAFKIPVQNQEDEIGQIALSLNRMSANLMEHIEKSYISELKQKQAELTALQTQINPHFLYNTLEAIRMRAVSSGDKETGQMIYILAEMFKSTIKSESVISVEQEICYVEQYLQLFKIRYGKLFSYSIDVSEDILPYGCINHLLQPLIENYVIHGFSQRNPDNLISLACKCQDGKLMFIIEDNGRGIPDWKVQEIQEQLAHTSISNTKSIGLLNVNERIKLMFGKEFGLSLQSERNTGTKAIITLPAMNRMELSLYVQGINR